jgi:hypothetical protein
LRITEQPRVAQSLEVHADQHESLDFEISRLLKSIEDVKPAEQALQFGIFSVLLLQKLSFLHKNCSFHFA